MQQNTFEMQLRRRTLAGTLGVLIVFSAAELISATPQRTQSAATTKVIVGATLIDGTGAPPLADSVIVIRNGKFAAISSGPNAVPADSQVIEVRGKFIVPGFIDGHSHYRTWVGEMELNHGVTSIIDVGNPAEWMRALREGIAKRKITRLPRIYAAGNALAASDEDATSGIRLSRPSTNDLIVSNAAAARKAVAELLDEDHFDFISIFQSNFTKEMLAAVIEETHRRGKSVFAHVGETPGNDVFDFVRAGGDGVTHFYQPASALLSPADRELQKKHDLPTTFAHMDPAKCAELISLMVSHHAYFTPELVYEQAAVTDRISEFKAQVAQLLANPDLQQYIPQDIPFGMLSLFERVRSYQWRFGFFTYKDALRTADLEEFTTGYRKAQAFIRQFVQAGGKIEVGTDASGGLEVPGLNVLQEMQLLCDAGLTPMQALQAATINPAESIGISDQVGTIQRGRLADLVVLDANPLENIANVNKISMVMQGGERVERGYHWNYTLPIVNPDLIMDTKMNGFNPTPQVFEVSPKTTSEGGSAFTLQVSGIGFVTRSQVVFNGTPVATHFESDHSLSAEIPAFLTERAGTRWIQVVNPAPGGGHSLLQGFIVKYR